MADNSEDTYVTQAGWLSAAGRVDLIDDVADSFERPSSSSWPDGRSDFWSAAPQSWPRTSGTLRSAGLLHGRTLERRTL